MLPLFCLIPFLTLTRAVPQSLTSRCVGEISSLDDVNNAVQCTTVNINPFTVPAGKTFSLNLQQGTTVNLLGDIQFGNECWKGPLFEVTGQDIQFNGNGHTFDGGGTFYWDGKGSKGSTKPQPMMKLGVFYRDRVIPNVIYTSIRMSGSFSDVNVVDSPARCIAVNNDGAIVVSGVNIDNSRGNSPNDKSNGLPAGRNTDGFDVAGDDVLIENSVVINQDDCLAINRGKNIVFQNNRCEDGHGISIGSISSDTTVDGVIIDSNTVLNSKQAFRIKTDKVATNSRVNNVTYTNNVAKNCSDFGVIFTQSYPDTLGTPGNGVTITDIKFQSGTTEVEVAYDAYTVAIDCGRATCDGTWDFSGLEVSGGKSGMVKNEPTVTGFDL